MIRNRLTSVLTAAALAGSAVLATGGGAQAAGTASTSDSDLGKRSLAKVLAADGADFDKVPGDFDILDNAVGAVLAAKPESPVAVLAQGDTRLTAFAPTDAAFRRLVTDVTGTKYPREQRVFTELAEAAGIDTIESVLLYHVVPGATVTFKQAQASGGAKLETALGETVTVRVRRDGRVFLADADTNDKNAQVVRRLRDINEGNRQIAHGVSQVLRPIDL